MDLQVRISVETAEMFEELRSYYQISMGMALSKSDVFIKLVSDTYDKWGEIDWKSVNEKKIDINKYDISESSLRPRLQVTSDIEKKIDELKTILPKELKIRNVTLGVCIKHILKYGLIEIKEKKVIKNENINIKDIIEMNKTKYLTDSYSEETQLAIKEFACSILADLIGYELSKE